MRLLLRFPFLVGFALAAIFLVGGSRSLVKGLQGRAEAPTEVACVDAHRANAEWVRITGCRFDFDRILSKTGRLQRGINALTRERGEEKLELGSLIVPVVPVGGSAEAPATLFVELDSEADKRLLMEAIGLPTPSTTETRNSSSRADEALAAALSSREPVLEGMFGRGLKRRVDSNGVLAKEARSLRLGAVPPRRSPTDGIFPLAIGGAIFGFVFSRWRKAKQYEVPVVVPGAIDPNAPPALDSKRLFDEMNLQMGQYDELKKDKAGGDGK